MSLARPTADVLIIGAGPAGLTAALALARQMHTAIVFDSGVYRNGRTKYMHTVPTWDHRDPGEFRAQARKELLTRYQTVEFQDVKVQSVGKTDEGLFRAVDVSGKQWTGKKLLLASGVRDVYPDIEGYDECWVSGIFHCLFCHGYEERSAPHAGVLAIDDLAAVPPALHLARSAAQLTGAATIYTNGNTDLGAALTAALISSRLAVTVDTRAISRLSKVPSSAISEEQPDTAVTLHFADGGTRTEGFLAHRPRTALNGDDFAAALGLEVTETGDYKTTPPFLQTSVPGVFAAGDCVAPAKIVPNALMTGALVGAGMAAQLQAEM